MGDRRKSEPAPGLSVPSVLLLSAPQKARCLRALERRRRPVCELQVAQVLPFPPFHPEEAWSHRPSRRPCLLPARTAPT